MAFMFEKLQVYQKADDLADHVAGLTETFPRGYFFLADQINRAALSVATNIAEGNGRFTKADRKNFFGICLCGRSLAWKASSFAFRRSVRVLFFSGPDNFADS